MERKTDFINVSISDSDSDVLNRVKASLRKQRDDQIEAYMKGQADSIIHTLKNMGYKDIVDITTVGKAPLAIFILCTCLLEQMATYRYGKNKNLHRIIKEYLPKYDGDVMQETRNRINHNYSLHEKYVITIGARHTHFNVNDDGAVVINMENFVEELGIAFESFANDLRNNRNGTRNNALKMLKKYGILGQVTMDVIIPEAKAQ